MSDYMKKKYKKKIDCITGKEMNGDPIFSNKVERECSPINKSPRNNLLLASYVRPLSGECSN